ncbi:NADP-dependent oxidoreductase [Kineococcus sp. GCM10028916]|uniref:NADP-dependent oxidoreductase n=1 Tax=Kineococcus sp. GCM10028916 TaxID=3273394 RepID=UPI0036440E7E
MRAVRFHRYGGPEVLQVEELPTPQPGPGEVVVEVRAAGINPGETAIRSGATKDLFPATFPSGQGSDLAGVVSAVGPDATWSLGEEVMGWSWARSSQASHVLVPGDQLIPKPAGLSWEVAGSLYVAGVTAFAAVRAVDPQPGETVAVSAAAGGVGSLVVQLLTRRGAKVLGIAGPANADWLRTHGAEPVEYGEGLAERLEEDVPDAFIDLFGPDYVQLAVDLGIPKHRIETIISFALAAELGVKAEGSEGATTTGILGEIAELVATGKLEVEIAASYPLEEVGAAFTELEHRHTRGKIVLLP